jgi:hypothetical protein
MKRFALLFLLLSALFAAAPLTAGAAKPRFTTIVVKHFTNASGVNETPEFIHEFSQGLGEGLQHSKIADHIGDEAASVDDAMAANSLVLEGRFTSLDHGAVLTKLHMEIDVYRISDHVLVKTISPHINYVHIANLAHTIGYQMADPVASALKQVNLASIPAGTPVPRSAPSAPASAAVPPVPPVFASVQFSSNPTGAEITIDGAYAGNTPGLIKLRPGTHSIRIAMNGYAPWERSIDTSPGESRNISAKLDLVNP